MTTNDTENENEALVIAIHFIFSRDFLSLPSDDYETNLSTITSTLYQ